MTQQFNYFDFYEKHIQPLKNKHISLSLEKIMRFGVSDDEQFCAEAEVNLKLIEKQDLSLLSEIEDQYKKTNLAINKALARTTKRIVFKNSNCVIRFYKNKTSRRAELFRNEGLGKAIG